MTHFAYKPLSIMISTTMLMLAHQVHAADTAIPKQPSQTKKEIVNLGTTTIVGNSKKQVMQNVGAAHRVNEKELAQFDSSDPHDVLSRAPGVYVRTEDGYGLRPNIAIRGVRAERSQNVTIMEDGILIKPAPYAAPAAYYFPNLSRMDTVEVFKGPSAIKYGPRTVGGAINMVTKEVQMQPAGEVKLTYGTDNEYKAEGFYTNKLTDTLGFAVDGVVYGADGFKTIDNRDNHTGFDRKDINLKLQWTPENTGDYDHVLVAKLGYADESSNETYLGLSDADYKKSPYRRYAGSQLDTFDTEHRQIHLLHTLYFPNDAEFTTTAYYNQFERAWNKLDGFANTQNALFGGGKVFEAVLDPAANQTFYNLILGTVNTSSLDVPYLNLGLDVTNNAREYTSTGIAFAGKLPFSTGSVNHELEAGLRIHQDKIERRHHTRGYAMENGNMVFNGFSGNKLINDAKSDAVSAYLLNTMTMSLNNSNDLKVALGLRSEHVESTLNTKVTSFTAVNTSSTNKESAVLPGIGAYFQATPTLGLLAGVHKGFSPAGPGKAGATADPEESLNYELGTRYLSANNATSAELVGFYSDYDNLIGRARSSSGSQNVGASFNGGAVDIYGAEITAEHNANLGAYSLPLQLVYTYTQAEFKSNFNSNFREWGQVSVGDELPYVPEHKARLQVGIESPKAAGKGWDAFAAVNYVGKMRELAGQGAYDPSLSTKSTALVDVAATRYLDDNLSLKLKVQNLFDNDNIASRRPFGARPVKPRTVSATVGYTF